MDSDAQYLRFFISNMIALLTFINISERIIIIMIVVIIINFLFFFGVKFTIKNYSKKQKK